MYKHIDLDNEDIDLDEIQTTDVMEVIKQA